MSVLSGLWGKCSPRVPLALPRLIMWRAVVVAGLGLVLGLVLGLLRLHSDVDEELLAARTLAQLSQHLALLPQQSDEQALRTLRLWQSEGELRHLQLTVRDGQGQTLMSTADEPPQLPPVVAAWLDRWRAPESFTVAWQVVRPQGGAWFIALSARPDSERSEALTFLLEGLGVLAGVVVGILLVMGWNTRRALAPLGTMVSAIGALQQGQRDALRHLPPMPVAELEAVAGALRALADALALAEAEQRRLTSHVLTVQDDERRRLARELHDEFGQRLTALRVDVAWLTRQRPSTDPAISVLAGMAEQIGQLQQDIRATLARLRPWPAGTEGSDRAAWVEALTALVASWQHAPGVGTTFQLDLRCPPASDPWAWPDGLAADVYRISQEALTNVARHAHAGTACLRVHVQAAGHLHWAVEDDGVGLPALGEALRRGNGLAGLKERVWAQGAELCCQPLHPEAERPGLRLVAEFTWSAEMPT